MDQSALTRLIFLVSGIFVFVFAVEESRVIAGILFSIPDYSLYDQRAASEIQKIYTARLRAQSERETATSSLILRAEEVGIYTRESGIMKIPEVPFVAQSPFGERGNPVFENACEEAVLLMSYSWAVKNPFTKETAREEIFKMADFERVNFGFHEDTSVADTARLMKEYFGYDGASVRDGVDVRDIIIELAKGNLVIIPVNGQKLGNPRFEPPGPIVHMILVRGYDFARNEFIVHDPGTQFGKDYRYSIDIIAVAFEDYSSGEEVTIGSGTRAMIVVEPKYEGRFDG